MSQSDNNRDDELFAAKARELFDKSAENLDGETRSRLNKGRHLAMEALNAGGVKFGRWTQWVPATGVVAAAAIAVVVWNSSPEVGGVSYQPSMSDFEILLNEDDFDMLENLEFYSWLEFDAEPGDNANVS